MGIGCRHFSRASDWLAGDGGTAAVGCALTLALSLSLGALGARDAGVPLGQLGVYWDGHVYIEIAKSFPFPYADEGSDFFSHAPGYPALIALLHASSFGAIHWGWLALLASWIPGAAATAVFVRLCRQIDLAPLIPTLAFVMLNPQWVLTRAAPQAENLAMLFALLCLLAQVRGRLGWSLLWLTLAGFTRYPAFIFGAALAADSLIWNRGSRGWLATLLWLSAPLAALGLWSLYLHQHLSMFPGLTQSRRVPITHDLDLPFAYFVAMARGHFGLRGSTTLGTLLFYLASMAAVFRCRDRRLWFMALWVGSTVVFHGSLNRDIYADDFMRLAILAWPGALVVVSCAVRHRARWVVVALLVIGVFWAAQAERRVARVIRFQNHPQWFSRAIPFLLEKDTPDWFSGWTAVPQRRPPPRGASGQLPRR